MNTQQPALPHTLIAAHGHIQPGPVVDATSCAAHGYTHREPPLTPLTADKPKNTHQPTA